MRAEATADNTSIRVSWEWSPQGVLGNVRVHYQPEGGSLMMHAVDNTTATNATLPNLQCNTKYSIWVYARGGQINRTSSPSIVSLQARGMYIIPILCIVYCIHSRLYHISPPAPPTPSNVTVEVINASSLRVAWRWAVQAQLPTASTPLL